MIRLESFLPHKLNELISFCRTILLGYFSLEDVFAELPLRQTHAAGVNFVFIERSLLANKFDVKSDVLLESPMRKLRARNVIKIRLAGD